MSYLEAYRLGVTTGCLLASGLAIWVALATLTVQRQVFPRLVGVERYQHNHEQRLDLLEEVEVHRSRLRLAEGTERENPATATGMAG